MTTPTLTAPPTRRRPPPAPPTTASRAHHRHGLSQLRPSPSRSRSPTSVRPVSGRSRSRTTSPSSAATLTREAIADATRPASGATSSCCPVDGVADAVAAGRLDAAARRRSARPHASASTGCGSRTTRATRRSRSRTGPSAIAAARAVEFGVEALACASTGNLAGATAAAAAAVGLPAYVFIPADLEPAKVDHALAYGATVVPIDGTYDDVNRLCLEVADETGWGFVNINLRPFYAEGSKTLAYEIAESLGWRSPDVVVGAGRDRGDVHPRRPRLRGARRARPHRAPADPLRRRPGGRLRPGRDGLRARHGRHRAGPRAGHDRPLAGHRQSGRRPLRGRAGARRAAARSRPSTTPTRRRRIRDVARLEGIYPETAGGVTLGAVAAAAPTRRHPTRRRGRRAADRQRAQDAGRADARARRRRGRPAPGPRARRRLARSKRGWRAARHEHRPDPADAPHRDRRGQARRGPGRHGPRGRRRRWSPPTRRSQPQLLAQDGDLNRFVNAFLNDTDVRHLQALDTPVGEADTLVLLPAMAGG